MTWDLPLAVEINGMKHNIRNKCDYRIILDVISALNDKTLSENVRLISALIIFYEDFQKITNIQAAVIEMMTVINIGEKNDSSEPDEPRLMEWGHDFNFIAPPISRVLGYDVRVPDKYTHWYTFIGAYMEIGDCYFTQIISMRSKLRKGRKLNDHDKEFYKAHKKDIDLEMDISDEELAWLESDW